MNDPANSDAAQIPRSQLRIGAGLFLFLAAVSIVLSLLAKNDSLHEFLEAKQEQVDRARKQRYSYEHYFIDFEDRLINEELPAADYSHGGVYLMGTSNLKWASRLRELPEKQRALIHNYGIGATSHLFQYHFLRFLVEHEGMLAAGGDKTMVVFGLSWHAVGPEYRSDEFFPQLWARHGLYRYDVNAGIVPLETTAWSRALRFERVRITGLIRMAASLASRRFGYRTQVRQLDPESYVRERSAWSGPSWEERMRKQVAIFEEIAKYLRARGVKVNVVLLPQGSWEDRLFFKRAYEDTVKAVCARMAIPVFDWTKLLDDDDFADSNHPNPAGVDKLNPKFLELSLPFLRSTGALDPTPGN